MKLRFDTLEKKPKLYNIAVISGCMILIYIGLTLMSYSEIFY